MRRPAPWIPVLIPLVSTAGAPVTVQPLPQAINHQGLLLDTAGQPRAGLVTLGFAIYATADGPALLCTEEYQLDLVDGYYYAELGRQRPFGDLFDGAPRYLGVAVDHAAAEPQPRRPLSSVPYALAADNVLGDISPRSVWVGGQQVIDGRGAWRGLPIEGVGGGDRVGFDTPEAVLQALRQVDGADSDLRADRLDDFESSDFVLVADLWGLVTAADGSGSGLDADRLDNLDSTLSLRRDQDETHTGSLSLDGALSAATGLSTGGPAQIGGAAAACAAGSTASLRYVAADSQLRRHPQPQPPPGGVGRHLHRKRSAPADQPRLGLGRGRHPGAPLYDTGQRHLRAHLGRRGWPPPLQWVWSVLRVGADLPLLLDDQRLRRRGHPQRGQLRARRRVPHPGALPRPGGGDRVRVAPHDTAIMVRRHAGRGPPPLLGSAAATPRRPGRRDAAMTPLSAHRLRPPPWGASLAVGALLMALLPTCTFDDSTLAGKQRCARDSDCEDGLRCAATGICGTPADGGPWPRLDAGPGFAVFEAGRPDGQWEVLLPLPDGGRYPADAAQPDASDARPADARPSDAQAADARSPVVDQGSPGCQQDADCPEQHVCQAGRCKPQVCWSMFDCWQPAGPVGAYQACSLIGCGPCGQDVDCAPDGVCRDGLCYQSCAAPGTCGNALLGCVGGACQSCEAAEHCAHPNICLGDGTCGPCRRHGDCEAPLRCVEGACAPCRGPEDCDWRLCYEGRCVDCATPWDCPEEQGCINWSCGRCAQEADCRPERWCVQGACVLCRTANDCADGLGCAEGSCGRCTGAADCRPGQLCASGSCVQCRTANDCVPPLGCLAGGCGPCRRAGDCREGQECRSGECRTP